MFKLSQTSLGVHMYYSLFIGVEFIHVSASNGVPEPACSQRSVDNVH